MRVPCLTRALICLFAASPHAAQAVTFFFDTGDEQSGVLGGPLTGTNPTVFVDLGATSVLHLWALPDPDDKKVVVSLGIDIVATGSGAATLTTPQFEFDNPATGGGTRWSGTALAGGLNVDAKLVSDQRAVYIPLTLPATEGGLGSATASVDPGFDPTSSAIHLGRLVLAAAADGAIGSAEIRLVVSPLLITHVTATGSATPEPVFFGFAGAAPEPAFGDGSTVGATSTTADAIVIVRRLGDADGDGDIDLVDYAVLADCLNGPDMPPLLPSGCLEPFDTDQDDDVDLHDVGAFLRVFP